jgi:hypothetical protein
MARKVVRMNNIVLALALFAVVGLAGAAVAGDQVICVNASAMLGLFLSYIEHGLPEPENLLAAPQVIFDAAQC